MKLEIVITAVVCCICFSPGLGLHCYECTTRSGVPGLARDPGCSPGNPMNDAYLKECGQNETYCVTSTIFMKLTTETDGTLSIRTYVLQCSSEPLSECAKDIYNVTGHQSSNGCFLSCQTDGCNRFTSNATEADRTTTTTPVASTEATTKEMETSAKTTPSTIKITTTALADTTSQGSTVLYNRVTLFAALSFIFSLIST